MSTTIYDIARSLSLSHTTVSRVLNRRQDRYISEATRTRVLDQARQMGYQPNRSAQALVTGRTRQIGLLMRHINTPYYHQALRAIEYEVRASSYQVLIESLDVGLPTTREDATVANWDVDGCLVFEGVERVQRAIAQGFGSAPHLVSMGGYDFAGSGIDHVGVDLEAGANDALEHLLAIGCRRIAHVTTGRTLESRGQVYQARCEAEGQAPERILVPSQTRRAARQAVREYVQSHGSPDGFFCLNDDIAIATYGALRDLGVRIPHDAAVIGFDGLPEMEDFEISLSTVAQPIGEICRVAWQILQQRMEGTELPLQQIILRPTLQIRESSAR